MKHVKRCADAVELSARWVCISTGLGGRFHTCGQHAARNQQAGTAVSRSGGGACRGGGQCGSGFCRDPTPDTDLAVGAVSAVLVDLGNNRTEAFVTGRDRPTSRPLPAPVLSLRRVCGLKVWSGGPIPASCTGSESYLGWLPAAAAGTFLDRWEQAARTPS